MDTVWTNGVHDYAETRVNTRVSASDLFRRWTLLTPFRSNKVGPSPWLVRNAEVTSSSLVSSTNLRSPVYARRLSTNLPLPLLLDGYFGFTLVLWVDTHSHRPSRITQTSVYRNVSSDRRPCLVPTRRSVNHTTAVSP